MEPVPAQPLPDVESTVAVKKEEDIAGPSTVAASNLMAPSSSATSSSSIKRPLQNNEAGQGTKKCNNKSALLWRNIFTCLVICYYRNILNTLLSNTFFLANDNSNLRRARAHYYIRIKLFNFRFKVLIWK